MIWGRQLFFVWSFCVIGFASAQTSQKIGVVLATQGSVTATDNAGNTRVLSRRSEILLGDTINVDAQGKVQLRFSDSSLLTLAENSKFSVDEYKFDAKEGDTFLSKLAKGGLRALPGAVEKNTPGVSVATPVAVMGVRGTLFTATSNEKGMALGFFQGAGWVNNFQGQLSLGNDEPFDFATVGSGEKEIPQGKMNQPDVLGSLEYDAPDTDASTYLAASPGTLRPNFIALLSKADLLALALELSQSGLLEYESLLKLWDAQVELRSEGLDCHQF